jgi:hypothetical protein
MATRTTALQKTVDWVDGSPEARAKRFFGGMDARDIPPDILQMLRQGSVDEAIQAFTFRMRTLTPSVTESPPVRPQVRAAPVGDKAGDAVRQLVQEHPDAESLRRLLTPIGQAALIGGGGYGLYRLAQKDGESSAARKGPEPSREEEVAARYGQDLLEQVYERGRK